MGAPNKTSFKPGDQPRLGKTVPSKTCSTCGETKRVSLFPKRYTDAAKKLKELDPARYQDQCKLCKKPAKPGQPRSELTEPKNVKQSAGVKRAQREAKRKKKAAANAKSRKKIREETRIESFRYMAKRGCEECGERDPRVLEYDHKNPNEKYAAIARLITDGFSWTSPRLRSEIAKCRVICSNCHRKHTVKQQGYYPEDGVQACLGKLSAKYKFDL